MSITHDSRLFRSEFEPQSSEGVLALDLDRTLLKTGAVTDLLLDGLAQLGVSIEEVSAAKSYVDAQIGKSFDLYEYIDRKFSPDTRKNLEYNLLRTLRDDDASIDTLKAHLLYEGVGVLFDALEERNVPFVILTHGSQHYQELKVSILRHLVERFSIDLPAIITDTTNKSTQILEEWFDEEGGFTGKVRTILGSLTPDLVVVVDDKDENLQSSNERIRGILIDNENENTEGAISINAFATMVLDGKSLREISAIYYQHSNR